MKHFAQWRPTSAGLLLAALASIGLHVGILYGLGAVDLDLDLDFELRLPAEVEFGVTTSMEQAPASAPESATPAPSEPPPSVAGEGPGGPVVDAGVPDSPDTSPPAPDAGTPDAGAALVAEAPTEGAPELPPGAQLAMRLDMRRIAGSPLAPAVREFFRTVPDWYYLLDGSGIDPIEDLDRIYLATPDPRRRSRLIIAGRVREGADQMRGAVAAMASARGEAAPWTRTQGIETAPWHDLDTTERVMSLLGPRQFAISRAEDLPTIVAMIRHRESQGGAEGLEAARGADALVSMAAGDALSLEVEGIHRYAQGQLAHLPERGRVSIREISAARVAVEGLAFFADEAAATEAQIHWNRLREQLSRRLELRILGLASVLDGMTLTVEGERVRIKTELSHSQARQILAFIGGQIAAMTGFVPPQPAAPTAPEPEAPTAPEAAAPAPAEPDAPAPVDDN